MSDDIRADMQKVAESLATPPDAPTEAAPEVDAAADAPDAPAAAPEALEDAAPKGRQKDPATGRFVGGPKDAPVPETKPTDKAAKPPVPGQRPTGEKAPPAPTGELRPPQSLKPAEREAFKAAPRELQEALIRREKEFATQIQRTAQRVQVADSMERTLAPFIPSIRAMGGDVLQTVAANMQAAHVLQHGSAQQRADLLAGLIQQFGDVDLLNERLSGQPAQGRPQQQAFDPRTIAMQAAEYARQSMQQEMEARHARVADSEVSDFADSHEFFYDVQPQMAVIMEAATRQGSTLSMEDAYTLACRMNPDVSGHLEQRARHQQANATQASTQRARAAAATVRTVPAVEQEDVAEGDDIVADLRRAAAQVSGRR